MKNRSLTHDEYEAEKARRQRAYDTACAAGLIAAANRATRGSELVACVKACDAAYLALIAPMPVFVEVV